MKMNWNQTTRGLAAAAGLLAVLAGPVSAATLWEFKFNETGTSPANTGTGSPAPALVTQRDFYGALADLHGADGSGVSRQPGDRALDLSGITTNGGIYAGKSFPPLMNVAYSNCTPIQNLTTLSLSGWFNAQATITTNQGVARLMSFNNYLVGFSVEFYTTNIATNQIKVLFDAAPALYFDVTAIMTCGDTNTWYFWAVTYDGTLSANNAKLYMGTPGLTVVQVGAARTANCGTLESTTTAPFSLNSENGSGTLKGLQDNVRVDNVVLSLAELDARRIADAAADIALYGKGNLVTNGDVTPILGDGTDFGSSMPAGVAVTNTFAITNAGADVLCLTGATPITFAGHAGDFAVDTGSMSTNIAAHSSTVFRVVFAPRATGARTGTVSVANTVAARNPYTFSVKGNGIGVEPVIGVMGKGLAIDHANMVPTGADGTDFGGADIAGGVVTNTFIVTNAGLALLTLTGGTPVSLSGNTGDFFIDAAGMSSSVTTGSFTSFRIMFDPAVAGLRTGVVSIASDDAYINPFTFAVRGTGQKPVIAISGKGIPITPGDPTPAPADGSDFGDADMMLGASITNTFAITNAGAAALRLVGVTPVCITGHASDFTVSVPPATNIAVGGSTAFKIVFSPTVIGIRTGLVSIANNDGDRTSYAFSIKGSAGVASNSIPYSEAFESYPDGFALGGTNGWSAQFSVMAVVTNKSYTNSYAGAFPIPWPHEMSLRIDGRVTNTFTASSYTNVWVDMILESKHWTNGALPSLSIMSNAQFAVCITTNRRVAVWNCLSPPAPACAWTELLDTDVPEDSYVRVTVEMAYTRDAANYFYYRVWVNETPSVSPRAWYAAANTNRNSFHRITAEGLFHMDDLTVKAATPFPPVNILASSAGYGAIEPDGTIEVPYGSTASFTNQPSTWYHVSSVTVDGASMGAPPVYTFTNVKAGHTIVASFAPDTVLSNTPNWWLADAKSAWTNNLSAASTNDADGDGLFTWEEYIAGTHPTNPASVLEVQITWSNGQMLVTLPTIEPGSRHEGLSRYYSLESCTNLVDGTWVPVPGVTGVRATGQVLTCTNQAGYTNRFYRGKVWLAP